MTSDSINAQSAFGNRPWLILANPEAGKGVSPTLAEGISRLLSDISISNRVIFTESADHIVELASTAQPDRWSGVAVLGGDGTASYAASGLIRSSSPLPLAVFPAGRGNDWVRTLRTESIEETIKGIRSGRTAAMDTGLCSIESNDISRSGIVFINSAGIGLDAHVLAKSIRIRRNISIGKLGYPAALLSALIEMPSWEGTLKMDEDEVFTGKYLSITSGVCPFVGGGMMLSPSSIPDDGKLDTAVVRPISRINLIRSMPMIYRGTLLSNPSVSSWSGKEFRLEARGKLVLELDGESIGGIPDNTTVILKSLPASIQVVVGPEY